MGASLIVGNLNRQTTEKQLERFLSSLGAAASVKIPIDQRTGCPRGFGLVEYRNQALTELALAVFNGRELGGQVLNLRWAPEDGARSAAQDSEPLPVKGKIPRHPDKTDDRPYKPPADSDDYVPDHRTRKRKGNSGKHGTDRRRGRGTRRLID